MSETPIFDRLARIYGVSLPPSTDIDAICERAAAAFLTDDFLAYKLRQWTVGEGK